MDNLDAVTFSLLALKLGLITEAQRREALEEAHDEAGGRNPDLQTLVRARRERDVHERDDEVVRASYAGHRPHSLDSSV